MAYSFGGGVNAQLGAVDYSPFLRGSLQGSQMAAQGAQAQGQAIGQAGQMVGNAIMQASQMYDAKKKEKEQENNAAALATGIVSKNPEFARMLNIGDANTPEGQKKIRAVIKEVGVDKILGMGMEMQQQEALSRAMSPGPSQAEKMLQGGANFEQLKGASFNRPPVGAMDFMQRAIQGGAPAGVVSSVGNAMTNAQRPPAMGALPPMQMPKAELEKRYPSDKFSYDIVAEQGGVVAVRNISPRAPAEPPQEIPNPVFQEIYKDVSSGRAAAEAAVKSAATYDKIIGIMDDPEGAGIVAGKLAKPELFLRKVGSAFGLKSGQVVNTEMIQAMIAVPTAQMIQNFGAGTGLSDADREFALRAAAGDFEMEPESLLRLAKINRDVANEARELFNERVEVAFPGDNAMDKRARAALLLPKASKKKELSIDELRDLYK